MRIDSLKKRYLAKLSANFIGLVFSMVTQAIIPRGLGVKAYGDFSFLSSFFTRIVSFLDLGASPAFYTKLCKRPNDFGLISFYLMFTGLGSFVLFIFIGCTQLTFIYPILLPDQKILYIYMAAVWGGLTWHVQILNDMSDAYGLTVYSEVAKIVQKFLGFIFILLLFFTDQLNLTHFYIYHYFLLVLLAVAFVLLLKHNGHSLLRSWKLTSKQVRAYTKEFYHYSQPLFIASLFGMVVALLERWMLQYFSGSVEQAYFGLSYKIGAICILFTSAMTSLLTREFTIAAEKNNFLEMARLFRRYIPLLYAVAAYFACFLAVEAKTVVFIMGGEKFEQAYLPVFIMAFYPIHQTYGQLSASVFYATGQTKLYRNIGIFYGIIGLPLIYLLLAPSHRMGLNAGAVGLAISYIVLQFFAVNTQLYYNSKLLMLNFWRYIGHQVISVGVMISLAMMAKKMVELILSLDEHVIVSFLVSGLIYSILVGLVAIVFPILFGLSKNDIHRMKNIVLDGLRMRESDS